MLSQPNGSPSSATTTFLAREEPPPVDVVEREERKGLTIRLRDTVAARRVMYHDPEYFMAQLHDERETPLTVEDHHSEWLTRFTRPRVCMLAPRDHAKTWTVICYLLWRVWRHNRDPLTCQLKLDLPEGKWEAVIFSAEMTQAEEFFEKFQSLMLANEWLFADVLPDFKRGRQATIRNIWSRRRSRLKNRAQLSIRAYRTSTRGLHPDLLVLDDVLSDLNSGTKYQRDRTWSYFTTTLLPMNAAQIIVIGTAFHYDDLLHRLRPKKPRRGQVPVASLRFDWSKYRAINTKTEIALWPARHSYEELMALREFDATAFSREYQNEPVDDAASMFPTTLTAQAFDPNLTFLPLYRKNAAQEFIIGGYDVAASAETGADYCVLMVFTVDRISGKRRLLTAERHRGMDFPEQITLLRTACRAYQMDLLIVEQNGLQRWLKTELDKWPETANCVLGHTTGQEKGDLTTGVPSLKISLRNLLWVIPTGDEECEEFAKEWQTEMAAFGWRDGKLAGIGEHDDTVLTTYFADRAVRLVEGWTRQPVEEIVSGEELGIEPVRIGSDY